MTNSPSLFGLCRRTFWRTLSSVLILLNHWSGEHSPGVTGRIVALSVRSFGRFNFSGFGVNQLGIYFACMGVTIHFEGQLKDEAAYHQLLDAVFSIAKAKGWSTKAIESKVTAL